MLLTPVRLEPGPDYYTHYDASELPGWGQKASEVRSSLATYIRSERAKVKLPPGIAVPGMDRVAAFLGELGVQPQGHLVVGNRDDPAALVDAREAYGATSGSKRLAVVYKDKIAGEERHEHARVGYDIFLAGVAVHELAHLAGYPDHVFFRPRPITTTRFSTKHEQRSWTNAERLRAKSAHSTTAGWVARSVAMFWTHWQYRPYAAVAIWRVTGLYDRGQSPSRSRPTRRTITSPEVVHGGRHPRRGTWRTSTRDPSTARETSRTISSRARP